jgi:hypothetical protein
MLVRLRRRNPTKLGVGSTQATKAKWPRMEPIPAFEMKVSCLFLKRFSAASPPACKPMKPTGWKQARRGYSAYASESDSILRPSSLVLRYSIFCGSLFPF